MSIYQKYYTDKRGNRYSVSLDYERDGNPRGYYLRIFPVELFYAGSGFVSVQYTIDAHFLEQRVSTCIKQVSRASKKAASEALEDMRSAIDVYFCPRGIARIQTLEEFSDEELMKECRAD